MTIEEQKRIIRKLKDLGEQGAIHISKCVEEWAIAKFTKDGNEPKLGSRGLCIQYRVAGMDEWKLLTWLSLTQFSWETQNDTHFLNKHKKELFNTVTSFLSTHTTHA